MTTHDSTLFNQEHESEAIVGTGLVNLDSWKVQVIFCDVIFNYPAATVQSALEYTDAFLKCKPLSQEIWLYLLLSTAILVD